MVTITGNTEPVKELLLECGFIWDERKKEWWCGDIDEFKSYKDDDEYRDAIKDLKIKYLL